MYAKFLVILALCLTLTGCVDLDSVVVTTPDFHAKPDGLYRGAYTLGPVKVTLDVAMKGGAIDAINLIQHRNGRGKQAEIVLDKVQEKQSLDVDIVAGATASSKALLKAVEFALESK